MKRHETRWSLKGRIWLWESSEEHYLHLPELEGEGETETKNDGKRIRKFVAERKKWQETGYTVRARTETEA